MESSKLFPVNHSVLCSKGHQCPEAVVEDEGRFFVTFGHCGFNSPANNRSGYRSEAQARSAVRRYQRPHFTAKIEAEVG